MRLHSSRGFQELNSKRPVRTPAKLAHERFAAAEAHGEASPSEVPE